MSFDPNLRLNLWPDHDEMRTLLNAVAARATWCCPGSAKGRLLTGHDDPEAIADTYLRAGAAEVVVKLGATGARAFTADGQTAQSRPFAVTPIDTVEPATGSPPDTSPAS